MSGAQGRRVAVTLVGCLAAIGLTAGAASAGDQKVKDPAQDVSIHADYCDVLTATARNKGKQAVVHSVKLAAPNVGPSAAMSLYINTRGKPKEGDGAGNRYGAEYYATPAGVEHTKTNKVATNGVKGKANKAGTKFSLKIPTKALGKPKKYGWMAFGPACGDGTDSAPGEGPVFSTAFVPEFKTFKTKR